MINESAHKLGNLPSCMDLIFTYQPNLSDKSGTHFTLHPNCHQIIYAKFDLEVLTNQLTLARFGTIKIHTFILSDSSMN